MDCGLAFAEGTTLVAARPSATAPARGFRHMSKEDGISGIDHVGGAMADHLFGLSRLDDEGAVRDRNKINMALGFGTFKRLRPSSSLAGSSRLWKGETSPCADVETHFASVARIDACSLSASR